MKKTKETENKTTSTIQKKTIEYLEAHEMAYHAFAFLGGAIYFGKTKNGMTFDVQVQNEFDGTKIRIWRFVNRRITDLAKNECLILSDTEGMRKRAGYEITNEGDIRAFIEMYIDALDQKAEEVVQKALDIFLDWMVEVEKDQTDQ